MSVFTSLGIVFLSTLILAFLMLIPGVFSLFFHYASGKYSRKKIDDLSLFFILGAETLVATLLLAANFILYGLSLLSPCLAPSIFICIIAGILCALSVAAFLFYFRKGTGTRLFISTKTANNFSQKASAAKTRSDAFVLGFTAGLPELIFTFPLYIIIATEFSRLTFTAAPYLVFILLFLLLPILPLFITFGLFRSDHNLATIEKLRVKNKPFFRFFISILYLSLAILIICFRIIL